MSSWKFSCEWKPEIPLPPEYSFPQAFNYLNPATNSFERCTVEVRRFHEHGYTHYVLGRLSGPDRLTKIEMSNGGVEVRESEVFRHWDAIELFKRFFEGQDFPEDITLREVKL